MEIDVSQKILDIKGEPLVQPKRDEDTGEILEGQTEDITVKMIAVMALVTPLKDEKIDGRAKRKLIKLADKIEATKSKIELSVSEISKIAKRVDQMYPNPLIVTRVWDILDYGTEDDEESA